MTHDVTHKREPHIERYPSASCNGGVTPSTRFSADYELPTCPECLDAIPNDYGESYYGDYPEFGYLAELLTRGSEL